MVEKNKQKNAQVRKVSRAIKRTKNNVLPPILQLLTIVVKRGTGDEVNAYLKSIGIKAKMTSYGSGTAEGSLQSMLGLYNKEKELIFAVIPVENSEALLDELETKFLKKEDYAGIAFTIPLKSVVKNSVQSIG